MSVPILAKAGVHIKGSLIKRDEIEGSHLHK
jgi:hypothetical protein